MALVLPTSFPQFDSEPKEWAYFLYKACIGSYKANTIVTSCEWAVIPAAADVPSYEQRRATLISRARPFDSVQAFLDHLSAHGQLDRRCIGRREPFHAEQGYYESLWAKGAHVEPLHLLHDAVLAIWSQWSPEHYCAQIARLEENSLDYDSLSAVIVGLYLLVVVASRGSAAAG